MTYQACVDSLATILKTVPEFGNNNISKADYRVLNGGFNQAIVLFPGGFTEEESTLGPLGDFWIDWEIRLELYVRYSTEPEVASKIAGLRQLIINKVAQYPTLDGVAFRAYIRRGEQPTPVFGTDNKGPYFWLQLMVCSVREELSDITSQE